MRTGLAFDDVLTAAQAGAAWAFEVLYRDLSPAVTGYLRLHGAAEPDDLASETFLGVFTGLAGFRGDEDAPARPGCSPSPTGGWSTTGGDGAAVRRSTDDPGDLAEHVGGDVEDDVLLRIGAQDVHELCARCPTTSAPCCSCGSWPTSRWSRSPTCMGRSVGSVKALQRRGLRSLRDRLEHRETPGKNFWAERDPSGPVRR